MKVRELIAELSKIDPDLVVLMEDRQECCVGSVCEGYTVDSDGAKIRVALVEAGDWDLGRKDEARDA